eukprot:8294678-Pyramimonas_sp.AAC.1
MALGRPTKQNMTVDGRRTNAFPGRHDGSPPKKGDCEVELKGALIRWIDYKTWCLTGPPVPVTARVHALPWIRWTEMYQGTESQGSLGCRVRPCHHCHRRTRKTK